MHAKRDFQSPIFRLLVAVCFALVAGSWCHASMMADRGPRPASDFTWNWLAARALLQGQDPYEVVEKGGIYDLDAPYIYPLPAAVATIPFATFFDPINAATLFIGVSVALLVWGLSSQDYHRLPLVFSISFLWATASGQAAPLIMASAILPALGWLTPVKPNLGFAAIAYNPSRAAMVGAAIFLAITLIINPHWVSEWVAALRGNPRGAKGSPITSLGGPILLLALLRWKRADARLLLVLAMVPQSMLFYDQLLLWLIPSTWKESLLLTALSYAAIHYGNMMFGRGADHFAVTSAYAPMIVAFLFLPCLIMVLRRPNEGELPVWLGSLLRSFPWRRRRRQRDA